MDEDFDLPAGEEMMDEDHTDLDNDNPTLKVGEEKEIGKQGLRKRLVKEGEGWECPEAGNEVEGKERPHLCGLSLVAV
ncbi:hypothetical protein BHE74_00005157 [Ensete ventricosum]|nr:hypothetical protein GW17_00011339 [Ensete ventricosum]RWW86085.1 hypothetical protein BHE74_00005157 [Ensete ventricosum]RZR86299.1 hypothetical protein BHM03_00013478 [Ensete ventricosum]